MLIGPMNKLALGTLRQICEWSEDVRTARKHFAIEGNGTDKRSHFFEGAQWREL